MIETKNKPLNLKYVSDVIGEDYNNWKNGDIGLIIAQTGTGKTFFVTGNNKIDGLIDKLSLEERLIYLCNRSALKQQVKLDLMKKYSMIPPILKDEDGQPLLSETGKKQIDLSALDSIHTIGQVTISSYHAVAHTEQNARYLKEDAGNLDDYKYIICDEIQFVLTDSSYMNKTNLVYEKIIKEYYPNSIIIYISATMDEVLPVIEKAFQNNIESGYTTEKNEIHNYSTGIDYSYLDIKYIQSDSDIVKLISNDKTDEKWLVFVTSEKSGLKIQEELSNYEIESVFVKSGIKNDETKSIIDNGNFKCKVCCGQAIL